VKFGRKRLLTAAPPGDSLKGFAEQQMQRAMNIHGIAILARVSTALDEKPCAGPAESAQ